ncbi:dienelactone hydrolase family protein [Nocardia brasiliensis]|uniref:Dienelactone hydrolase family protein n=1 Tax=Nocardia brasiliensis TaxID=37326 RepID=A0A6G9XSL7_NOCBR|nr:dienelactone hydrolase family protein [Nocardia brasiliensis]QIS03905.1 dienelactone hydrolase family protein [Nocardia brasiliensis]
MDTIELATPDGRLEAMIARPSGPGPWPGVVVVHDAMGFSADLRRTMELLTGKGYLVVAPNLFSRGRVRCVRSIYRALVSTGDGPAVRDVLAARDHLVAQPDCTGRTAVVGFCMGGGFALLVAPKGFDASAPFYPSLFADYRSVLDGACPVVASFGARDPMLIGKPAKLEQTLTEFGVEHDVKVYPRVTHSFANLTPADPVLRVTGLGYSEDAAGDAWERIFAFFETHLSAAEPPVAESS